LCSGTGDAFCSIFTAWVELLGTGQVKEALVKTTSAVQQLIRVTMALQHGCTSSTGSAAAVRLRELQVTHDARLAICRVVRTSLLLTPGLQVVAGRDFISSPPEYDVSKVRVWCLSPADVMALEQQ
jgi:hypothetical protein